VYASQDHKPVYGLSLVLLVWTNGTARIPLGLRFWHKGGPSKYALALELLRYARNRLAAPSLCCSMPGIPPEPS
jgi:hypothetical protein